MKAPIDPSEPMFPLRLNEPVCQYYMKHGTCKFGQACKFHHPPQAQLQTSTMNGTGAAGRKNDSPQMLWNNTGADSNVQLLPQRPDEPNCIFFLKNGRCKYGSTCRYHHPLNYHDRRPANSDDGRRQHLQGQQISQHDKPPKVHYVTSLPPGYSQGHFVVADGAVTFLSLDGAPPAQVISLQQGNKDTIVYTPSGVPMNVPNRPLGHSRDVASSSSNASIASSYETANSHMDLPNMGPLGDSSSSLWNRPKKSSSSNSLGAYNMPDSTTRQHIVQSGRAMLAQNMVDNMSLPRVASTSSATSDSGSVYFDASPGLSRHSSVPHFQVSSGTSWRGRRSNSFDHAGQSNSYHSRDDDVKDGPTHARMHDGQRSPMARGRPPPGGRRRPLQAGEVDDGLSMMTSALLTMLDTPEEAAAEGYDGYYDEQSVPSSRSTPQMRPEYPPLRDDRGSPYAQGDAMHYHGGQYQPAPSYFDPNGNDRVLGLMNRMEPHYEGAEHPQKLHGQSGGDFLGWHNSAQHLGRPLQENSQSMAMGRPQSTSNHGSSDVGLYLH